ncbi:MAG: DUF4142 domain-containing protein [Phycisphaerales bacterium]|nr:DUF4142 domain-containing protein [Phycisphaerales bacterium]
MNQRVWKLAMAAGMTGVVAGMAGLTGCADWRGERADADHRTSEQRARDERMARAEMSDGTRRAGGEAEGVTREDPYGGSPDVFGSGPYSPANRGAAVTRYDRRGIEALRRETSWQSPGGDMSPASGPGPGMASGTTVWTEQARMADQARMAEQARATERARVTEQGRVTEQARASEPARATDQPRMTKDAALVGVSPDSRILSILHAKNIEEVEMGRLARAKGASADVRRFGEELEKDHGENYRQVQSLAKSREIMLMDAEQMKQLEKGDPRSADGYMSTHEYNQRAEPDAKAKDTLENPSKDMKHDAEAKDWKNPDAPRDASDNDGMKKDPMAELKALSGSEFDRAFADKMLKGHRELIRKVEKCRQDVSPEVGQFLERTLTTLREHEQTAERLAAAR